MLSRHVPVSQFKSQKLRHVIVFRHGWWLLNSSGFRMHISQIITQELSDSQQPKPPLILPLALVRLRDTPVNGTRAMPTIRIYPNAVLKHTQNPSIPLSYWLLTIIVAAGLSLVVDGQCCLPKLVIKWRLPSLPSDWQFCQSSKSG